MASLNLAKIQALVEEAVDNGAGTVEEIHQAVAGAPLEVLKQIEPLSGPAGVAEDLTVRTIGAVYETIRLVNEQVGIFAEQLLATHDDSAGSDET